MRRQERLATPVLLLLKAASTREESRLKYAAVTIAQ